MTGILIVLEFGNLLAILLVVFIPGYVLVAVLFPDNKELDWIERSALSLGLSIAVVPLISLILNFTPFGIRFAPLVVTVALFIVVVGLAAWAGAAVVGAAGDAVVLARRVAARAIDRALHHRRAIINPQIF